MKVYFISIMILIIPAIGFSATIHVPADYATIQEAIDAASAGDTVLVASGTYVENIDFLGKDIVVKSEQGPQATVIDGNKAGPVATLMNGESPDAVLEGFTIQNGSGTYNPNGYYYGGGIRIRDASPTITGNTISNNTRITAIQPSPTTRSKTTPLPMKVLE
ncbi:MAG: DUF1565 domain-containing protein [Planctomycetota bacterium]|jgi:hypothetical protein